MRPKLIDSAELLVPKSTIDTSKPTPNMSEIAWASSAAEMLKKQGVSQDEGLNEDEVKRRLQRYGPNSLRQAKTRSAWRILFGQFKSLIVLLLSFAAALSFAFGDWVEGGAVIVVILLNALIGFLAEFKAIRSMEALHRLTRVTAKVRRNQTLSELPSDQLVPGDIVTFEGGDLVSADLRLIQASKIEADESTLTGESAPVEKQLAALPRETLLGDRTNLLFKGTTITRGAGEGVVIATGMQTELGEISSLMEETEDERTPLEIRLDELGRKLVLLTLGVTVIVIGAGLLGGKNFLVMIKTAIALAVAAIPEGLTIVATIALARGMWRMAKRNALINRLSAVETLGATNIILTDKTGTLTENQMTVVRLVLACGEVEVETNFESTNHAIVKKAVEIGVLCNNASLTTTGNQSKGVGDPMEVAFLALGVRAGVEQSELVADYPQIRQEAFDSETNMMATFHESNGRYLVVVKGAPNRVLESCTKLLNENGEYDLSTEARNSWLETGNKLAERGLRVLSLATKTVDSIDASPYQELTFVGFAGLVDPPRTDVREAILQCQQAGIRVVMVTGDHKATALNVANKVGLTSDGDAVVVEAKDLNLSDDVDKARILRATVFSRVNPKQKLDLVSLFQKNGFTVAMTGDGVNDAPALKKADIGIAMGMRGTQVAREAADMVLKDDAFSSIVASIEQGRVIFNNIRKFVIYLLSCNISEILVVTFAAIVNAPLPLLPLQILFLNLVTDVFPALALGVGEGDPAIMRQPPRDSKEAIIEKSHWMKIAGYGLLITVPVLGAFFLATQWPEVGPARAVTVAFLTLGFAQLWHVFNMRDSGSQFFRNDVTRNPYVWGAVAVCSFLMVVTVYFRPLGEVLKVVDPGLRGWLLVLTASFIPLLVGQLLLLRTRQRTCPSVGTGDNVR